MSDALSDGSRPDWVWNRFIKQRSGARLTLPVIDLPSSSTGKA